MVAENRFMSQPLAMRGLYPLRVLVADDARSTRSFFTHLLGQRGIEADCSDDGREAWRVLQSRSFDVVITDLEMPRWSGIDLVRAMRKSLNDRLRMTPVLVNSSVTKLEVVKAIRSYHETYFMPKPIVTAELDTLLRTIGTTQRRGRVIPADRK